MMHFGAAQRYTLLVLYRKITEIYCSEPLENYYIFGASEMFLSRRRDSQSGAGLRPSQLAETATPSSLSSPSRAISARTPCSAPRPRQSRAKWGCPIEGCGRWFLGPWDLEGHTAAEHPGWTATYELLRPYPNQRQRVVYRRSPPPTS
jgi:hypothetical protein